MYSSNDFERLFIRYKAEAVPAGVSMQTFCDANKVPYNLFLNWYKSTRHKVVPVLVTNRPDANQEQEEVVTNERVSSNNEATDSVHKDLRILIDLRISNGMHIRQGNLSYEGLRRLVENLEVLC